METVGELNCQTGSLYPYKAPPDSTWSRREPTRRLLRAGLRCLSVTVGPQTSCSLTEFLVQTPRLHESQLHAVSQFILSRSNLNSELALVLSRASPSSRSLELDHKTAECAKEPCDRPLAKMASQF